MISVLLSKLVLLVFGTLYPAYASYKTVKTKNVRDYVKWMMYWIVFAFYTFIEIFTDIFVAFWCPFYYEFKILFVLWLMCPATRGSTFIFKKIINPYMSKHEMMIDSFILSTWNHGYNFARRMGYQGLDYMVEVILNLLRKGHITAASLLPKITEIAQNHSVIKESSVGECDLKEPEPDFADDEFDMLMVETPELSSKSVSKRSCVASRKEQTEIYYEVDSASESDCETSVRRRPLHVATRSKVKVSSGRQHKKTIHK